MLEIAPLNHLVGSQAEAPYAPVKVDPAPFTPFGMMDVDVHTAVFEVPMAQALAILPPSLHPAVPAYGNVTSYRVRESEIGAFEWSVVGVACRSVLRPRMLALSAFASTEAAVELLTTKWGLPAELADVRTRFYHDAGLTTIKTDRGTILDVMTMNPETLLGSARAIRYPQSLSYVSRNGKIGLQQHDIGYEYTDSYRGVLVINAFDEQALTGGRISPTDLIAGTFSKVNAGVMPVRIVLDPNEVGKLLEI